MTYYNIHTHLPSLHPEDISIINILVKELCVEEKETFRFRSYGIHPWFLENIDVQMENLITCLARTEAVAVGEVGLDKVVKTDMALQTTVFHNQVLLAEKMNKPVIIHCVKAWTELSAVKKTIKPQMPWIIHGFRGNREQAAQLIRQGFYLSFGEKFNIGALQAAWPNHVLVETDTAPVDIRDIYEEQVKSLSLPLETFTVQIEENTRQIFNLF